LSSMVGSVTFPPGLAALEGGSPAVLDPGAAGHEPIASPAGHAGLRESTGGCPPFGFGKASSAHDALNRYGCPYWFSRLNFRGSVPLNVFEYRVIRRRHGDQRLLSVVRRRHIARRFGLSSCDDGLIEKVDTLSIIRHGVGLARVHAGFRLSRNIIDSTACLIS